MTRSEHRPPLAPTAPASTGPARRSRPRVADRSRQSSPVPPECGLTVRPRTGPGPCATPGRPERRTGAGSCTVGHGRPTGRSGPLPLRRQRIGLPDSVRAITSRWISLVPSKIV
ncbi:hypothetical protein GCM10010515_40220 [Streptomyces fructofermentans]|uniref:Uncharacterized protein n=1 Tax=Streptomyces fructofermentans TaxID=152141 RepID=A0A918KLS4_9ACTN|nr:hypothetical protein GCM10010515_40220 [Streptomyces fructofermentans]